MKIIKLPQVKGLVCNLLRGSSRFAYGLSDYEEFYELKDWQDGGGYQGGVLYLYDLENNEMYQPFKKKRNVTYAEPLLSEGKIFFLQYDYDAEEIILYKFIFGYELEKIKTFNSQEMDLYNLSLIGENVNLISQDSELLVSYYPEKFKIELRPNEGVVAISEDLVYISAWIEEGVANDLITDKYKYYEKLIVRDKTGKKLSEEVGNLDKYPDGKWRLS